MRPPKGRLRLFGILTAMCGDASGQPDEYSYYFTTRPPTGSDMGPSKGPKPPTMDSGERGVPKRVRPLGVQHCSPASHATTRLVRDGVGRPGVAGWQRGAGVQPGHPLHHAPAGAGLTKNGCRLTFCGVAANFGPPKNLSIATVGAGWPGNPDGWRVQGQPRQLRDPWHIRCNCLPPGGQGALVETKNRGT
jgi:hypothetical protein